jgi:hypothetical protein
MTYWGWGADPVADPDGAEAYLTGFWQGIGGSAWAAVNTEYNGPGGAFITNPTNQYGGSWHDDSLSPPPFNLGTEYSNAAAEAAKAEAHFGYDPNGIYFVALPHGDDGDFTGGYCAYHGAAKDAQGRAFSYAMLPYVSDFPTVNESSVSNALVAECGVGVITGSPHPRLDAFSIVAGHEYAESVTDPQPASGWYDKNNGETGDICAFVMTGQGAHTEIHLSTGDYGVQSLWSNAANECVTQPTPPAPPPPPPPSVQTGSYVGPVGQTNCLTPGCVVFDVPPGASTVRLAIHDDVSPHAAGYYCIETACDGAQGSFCDGATIAVPAGTQQVLFVIDNYGSGATACLGNAPVASQGTVTATFT